MTFVPTKLNFNILFGVILVLVNFNVNYNYWYADNDFSSSNCHQKIRKMNHFWHFNDHMFGIKHDN